MVAVVATELKKPSAERRWEGRVAGVVPYTLRIPSPERAWRSFWDPDNPHLFVPRGFGVGWRLNLAEAQARLDRLFRGLMGTGPGQSRSRSRTNSSARP